MDGEHQDVGTSLEILVRGVELCPKGKVGDVGSQDA